MAQEWTKEVIKAKLETEDYWVIRGIECLYSLQTDSERAAHTTRETNGVGFNSMDADILTSFAKQIAAWRLSAMSVNNGPKYLTPLSAKQMAIARKKILKYAGQLTKVANGEI